VRVHLYTRDGGFVTEATIPPFAPPPEVITWGARLFVIDDGRTDRDDTVPIRYVEGIAWVVHDHTPRPPS